MASKEVFFLYLQSNHVHISTNHWIRTFVLQTKEMDERCNSQIFIHTQRETLFLIE